MIQPFQVGNGMARAASGAFLCFSLLAREGEWEGSIIEVGCEEQEQEEEKEIITLLVR